MAASVVHVTAHYPPYLGGLEKVVEALAAYRRARGLNVVVLTSRDRCAAPNARTNWTSGTGRVRRLWSRKVAHTAIIPGLPFELLRLPAARCSIFMYHRPSCLRQSTPRICYAGCHTWLIFTWMSGRRASGCAAPCLQATGVGTYLARCGARGGIHRGATIRRLS